MDIQLHEITVRDVFDGYYNDEESGQVVAYGGKLNVPPAYLSPLDGETLRKRLL